jgi:hypothetical protein
MTMRRLLVTAATALAMAAAPTVASAQRASTPAPASATEVQPSSEEADGSEIFGRKDFILPLLLLVGVILALTLTLKDETQEIPTSP